MKTKFTYPNLRDIEKIFNAEKELFGADKDQTQAQPVLKNALGLIAVEKHNIVCIKEDDNLIAWSIVVPTTRESMEKFLNRTITEAELFDTSVLQPSFETLYLMEVVVLPRWRRKGVGLSLLQRQTEYFKKKYEINVFYALTMTEEGKKLIRALGRELHLSIPCREG